MRSVHSPGPRRATGNRRPGPRAALTGLVSATLVVVGVVPASTAAAVEHLVVSEVVTGGTSASDELIELYNPSSTALPLEGLELIYVTASGATISRRAAWGLGASEVPPGGHVLVANEAGAYAAIADVVYASGIAATGGSVAIRIQGAATPVDAVGWGSAASAWLEGTPAPAPSPGGSIERLPGGDLGSTTDTDDNAADFAVRSVPDPRNASSDPVRPPSGTANPSASTTLPPTPTATDTPSPSPSASPAGSPTPALPTPTPTPAPTPAALTVAEARRLADGARATVLVTALTSSDFADGGGYVADATAGIAVLGGETPFARGDGLLVTGTLDDRFAQRTLRAESVSPATGPEVSAPQGRATGAIDESTEGRLVRVDGSIDGGATVLSGGLAFDVDDGSGPARIVVGSITGIDTTDWTDGSRVRLVGVVGQRDSSGSGTEGYRIQPRDRGDVEAVSAPPSATATPDPSSDPEPSPTVSPTPPATTTVAAVRAAPKNARVSLRGVVTLPSGLLDDATAVVQDGTGAILLRLGDEAGALRRGQLVEVTGMRSTKAGMESVRVAAPPRQLGSAAEPAARALRTGEAGEALEARVVVARGALTASARRAASGSVSFTIDDGSGELRVVAAAALAVDDEPFERGAWVEVVGVLGQETTGSQPTRGYRIWPRAATELRVVAPAGTATVTDDDAGGSGRGGTAAAGGGSAETATLGALDSEMLAQLRIGATLVVGAWDAAGLAGVLWDGRTVVGIAGESSSRLEASGVAASLPASVELGHLENAGAHPRLGIPLVRLGDAPADVVAGSQPVSGPAPHGSRPSAAWVTVVGSLAGDFVHVRGGSIRVTRLCERASAAVDGRVSVTGIAIGDGSEIATPCDGVRPAPSLARASGRPAAQRDVQAKDLDEGAAVPDTRSGRRRAAAAFLGAAVLAVVGGALVHRRWREPTADADAPAPSVVGAGPDASDPADAGPRLTLVPVPREHGP